MVALGQRQLLYHPNPNPLRQTQVIGAQALTLTTEDGERLQAWWLPPPHERAPVVLYLHGNGANLDNRAGRIHALHQDGFGILALSWRGYGGSTGRPSEVGWAIDARRAYDELIRRGVPASQIVVFGESLGSAHALMLAAERPLAGLLLDSSFDSALSLAQAAYPWLPVRWLMRDPHRADLAAQQLTASGRRIAVMQVHCADDPVSPLPHAESLRRNLPPGGQWMVLPQRCHVPAYSD
jgi:pimeloyl-ACP methyl ester carboxylesterase